MQYFFEERDEFSFLHLERKFNLNKPYYIDLRIENYNNGKVILNNNELKSESFFGSFYSEFELPISIEADIGYSYIGYLENTITGRSGDTLNLDIKFIEKKLSETDVIINEINYVDDCFEIYNREDKEVDLSGWIIIDKNNNEHFGGTAVNVGNPHAVFFVNNCDNFDLNKIGPEIENYKIFPEKCNVSLAEIKNKSLIKLKVWERGAGLTKACGTAACAAAAIAVKNKLTERKIDIKSITKIIIICTIHVNIHIYFA